MPLHRGKIARDPTVIEVRALTRDDLSLLQKPEARGAQRLEKLRDPHHRLARYIAAGIRLGEAAERCGYSHQRAQTLMSDPAFKELVEVYRQKVTESWAEKADTYHEMLFSNMVKAERMLSEKLEEADETGELPSTRDLIAIARDAADRTGYGKRQTNLNVNVDFAAKLEAAVARSRSARTIEGTAIQAPALAPQSPPAAGPPAASAPEVVIPQSARVRRI